MNPMKTTQRTTLPGLGVKQPDSKYGTPSTPEDVTNSGAEIRWKQTLGRNGETHQLESLQTSQQKKGEHHRAEGDSITRGGDDTPQTEQRASSDFLKTSQQKLGGAHHTSENGGNL